MRIFISFINLPWTNDLLSNIVKCFKNFSRMVVAISNKKLNIQIFFYLNDIFEAAGVEEETQSYASCAVGAVNVFMTIVSVSTYILKIV